MTQSRVEHVEISFTKHESWGEEDEEEKPADSSGPQFGQIHEKNHV